MTMKQSKRSRLETAGWKVGNAQEFLGLSDEENAYVEMKILLAESLSSLRKTHKVTQTELAALPGSSQSRVAKMEAGDPTVSADLLLKGMLALGATRKDIGKALGSRKAT